jgi:putative Mn2+ efflux pump MntP
MVVEGLRATGDCTDPDAVPPQLFLNPLRLLALSVATSIDALAVGLSFSLAGYPIFPAVLFIGLITFALSAVGVKAGSKLYVLLEDKVEIVGGVILIAIGINILVKHTFTI